MGDEGGESGRGQAVRSRTTRHFLIVLAGLAFVSLGLPDGLLGVAWPSMRAFFGLDLEALGSLLVATTAGYVASSFSSGALLRRLNLGAVLASSCFLTGAALLGYATASHWPTMIALGIVLGLGAGAIDAALNTYVATEYGARALNWLHAFFGVGAATGPAVMMAVLGVGLPWQRGYVIVGIAQVALAGVFALTYPWWPGAAGAPTDASDEQLATIGSTLHQPGARLGIAVFFMYSGVEASVGAWMYTLLHEGRGVAAVPAGAAVSLFWGALTAGRLLAAVAGGRVPERRLLSAAMAAMAIGAALIWLHMDSRSTFAAIAVVGLACGPVFPTLVAMTPARVGRAHAANAVGFEIAASALGLSVLPGFVGVAASRLGLEMIAILILVFAVLLVAVYWWLERAAPAH